MVIESTPEWSDREAEVAEALQVFARSFLDGSTPLEPERVVAEAARAVPHAATAGLTLIRRAERPQTLAATTDLAERVDEIQYDTGEGPCLEAIEDNDVTVTDDLSSDTRWPAFCRRAVDETPVRSMMGVRVLLGGSDRGALNFYALRRGAFSDLDVGVAAVFATLASLALQHALERHRADHLQTALESSRQIGMAMGILMSRQLLTPDQAFEQLRNASQYLQRRVRDIAEEVMQTGTLPDMPPRRPGRS